MKHNSFILPDHSKKYSMIRQQEQFREQDTQRKRREQQGQNASQTSKHTMEEQHWRIESRECERKRMDEARAA